MTANFARIAEESLTDNYINRFYLTKVVNNIKQRVCIYSFSVCADPFFII